MTKAIFLDKDGTIIQNINYNVNINRIRFIDGLWPVLRKLKNEGYKIVIVTNQPGIAKGYFSEDELKQALIYIADEFKKNYLTLDGFYYCPHHPEATIKRYKLNCNCRKPKCGMFYKASFDMGISLKKSWYIGDILDDVEAGNLAGCRTVLINNGCETEWKYSSIRKPYFQTKNLNEAIKFIIENDRI